MKPHDRIAELEAELAEMRLKLAEMHGARLTWADRALKAEQKLIDMRRTHVKVKEKCGTCGGEGMVDAPYPFEAEHGPNPCPDCIDGLVLADGLIPFGKDWYAIPASLIEGEG